MTRRTVIFSEQKKEMLASALNWVVKEGNQWVVYPSGGTIELSDGGLDDADRFVTDLSSARSNCAFSFSESLFVHGNPILEFEKKLNAANALQQDAERKAEYKGAEVKNDPSLSRELLFGNEDIKLAPFVLPAKIYSACTQFTIRPVGREENTTWKIIKIPSSVFALTAQPMISTVSEEVAVDGSVLLTRNLEAILLEKREFESHRQAEHFLEAVLTVAAAEMKCYRDAVVVALRSFSSFEKDALILNTLIANIEKCDGKLSTIYALINQPVVKQSFGSAFFAWVGFYSKTENKSLKDQLNALAEKVKTGVSLERNVVLEPKKESCLL